MRWSTFFTLQGLLLALVAGLVYIHRDDVVVVKVPPKSIAEWYTPQNKRQVWLHTMFKLRREMLAVELYAKAEDGEKLQQWTAKLGEDYAKIAEMVPEWSGRVDATAMANLQRTANEQRFGDVTAALDGLNASCKSCHADFRAVTAALYRAPDFSNLEIARDGTSATPLKIHMRTLNRLMNTAVIAIGDGQREAAQAAYGDLATAMGALQPVCTHCHDDARKTYPTPDMAAAMAALAQSLDTGTAPEQGKAMGTLAVLACAQCHGTHRLSSDLRDVFATDPDWAQQLKHGF